MSMTTSFASAAAPSARAPATAAPGGRSIASLLAWAMRAYEVGRQRRYLAALDDAALADIGTSRATARAEAARPFWDLPQP